MVQSVKGSLPLATLMLFLSYTMEGENSHYVDIDNGPA